MADCNTPTIYVGNYTLFVFEVVDSSCEDASPVDLSGLSGAQLEMIFVKPDASRVVVEGVLSPATDPLLADGADGRYQYQAPAVTFLDQAGQWARQGHITLAGGEQYWPDIIKFRVHATL